MWRNGLPQQQKSHLKTVHFLYLNAYISKTNLVTPIFLLLESD